MTKVLKAMAGAVAVVAATMFVPAEASAATQTVTAAPNCQWGSSYGTVVASANVNALSTGTNLGKVQLCRDGNYNYWGFLMLSVSPSASVYGNVQLGRQRDGATSYVDCNSSGGNGVVIEGQHVCWTPKLTGLSGAYLFQAEGYLRSSHTGDFTAYGYTPLTR